MARVGAVLVAWACAEEQGAPSLEPGPARVRTVRQEANSVRKVLILGPTVSGGLQSPEARAVQAMVPNPTPFQIDIVTPAQWKAMTAEQFMSYRALIIGDAACTQGTAAWQAALDTRDTWGAVVDGNIIAIGSNLASNSWSTAAGEVDPVVQSALEFAVERPRLTGMYVSLGCAYQNAPAGTTVDLLSPFGTFKVAGLGCVPNAHVPAQYPPTFSQNIWDGLLIGMDECSAKSVFTVYPQNDFAIAGLAVDDVGGTMPGAQLLYDYDWAMDFVGTPFILARGSTAAGFGCGGDLSNIPSGEECDLGDSGNGSPFFNPSCSWACRLEWCGDGILQTHLGETCDNGIANGRDVNGNIVNGQCSKLCRVINIPTGSPPTVVCKNVTVVATTNTCGAAASIDDGSFDVDNDLVGCTQNPAGPFHLGGPQTVTLTCTDQKNHVASKTCTVTVTDGVAPAITLTGSSVSLQCGVDTYSEQRATVVDSCPAEDVTANLVITNPMTSTSPAKPVGTYSVLYNAKDKAGNPAPQVTRTVTVNDTLKPTVTVTGLANQAVECSATATYTDPGATATDACVGSLTSAIVKGGSVNVRVPGTYSLTYDVKDPSNNAADQKTRLVTVSDKTAPFLAVAPYTSVDVECGDPNFAHPPVAISDSCFTNGPFTAPVPSRTVNTRLLGGQSVTYTAKDPANNTGASGPRNFMVRDTLQPTLTLLGASPMTLECGDPFPNPDATAMDQCAGDLTFQIARTGSVNNRAPGTYNLGYSVTDGRTAAVTADRTVTVQDTLEPVVSMNGAATVSVECGDPAYQDQGASASDKCAGPLPAVPSILVDPEAPGTYSVSYSATDPSGNVGTAAGSRTVTVQDTLPPVIALNGPANSGLECGNPFTDPGASASDQCAGPLTPVVSGGVNHMQPGSYTLGYSATDPSGKAVSVSRTVTVSDTVPPVVTMAGPTTAQVECGTGPYQDPGATAGDMCAGPQPVVPTVVVDPNSPGSYTIQYQATDPSGNTGTAAGSRTVTVKDTQEPVVSLNGAASQTLECGTAYTELGATASDVCKGNLRVTIFGGVNNKAVSLYTVEYSATDGVFTKKASRTVNVQDTLAPDITVLGSANTSFECGSTYVDSGATANDACAGDVTRQIVSQQVGDPSKPGSFTVNYTVTDPVGNTRTLTGARTVTVTDNTPPVLVRKGAPTVSLECGFPYTDEGATANDACFGDVTGRIVTVNPVATATPGNYTVRYNVTDQAGQSAPEVTRVVRVFDTLPPEVTVNGPLSQTLECGVGAYQDPGASAVDRCSNTATVTSSTVVDQNAPGNYTIRYTATDPSGNSATSNVSRSVTVQDTLPPMISLNGSANPGVECGTPYGDPGAVASDLCKGMLPISKTGSVDHWAPGSYTLGYSATDGWQTSSAIRTVTVSDTQLPTITVQGPVNDSVQCGSPYVDRGATASDVCSGNLTAAIIAESSGNPSQPGTFSITYKVKDPSGNERVAANARTVTINDNEPPVMVLNGPSTLGLECKVDMYTERGAQASDACFGDVTNRVVTGGDTVNTAVPGTYVRTYNVTDQAGQSAPQLTRTVSVADVRAPSITVLPPFNHAFECGSGPYTDPGATASDLCAGDLTAAIMRVGQVIPSAAGQYTLSYSVTDPSGNQASSGQTRTVTVQDTLPPSIALTGNVSVGLECGVDTYTEQGATANDACAGNLTNAIVTTGNVNPAATGSYMLTYTVTDPSGHDAQTTRQVNVSDTLAPTLALEGPATQFAECGGQYADPGARAADQCAGDLTFAIVRGGSVDPSVLGPYTVTYDVSDPAGHAAAQVTRAVTVRDSLPPSITVNGPLSLHAECGSTYTDPGAVANDQCAGNLTAAIVATQTGNTNAPGSFEMSYSVKDPSGNTATSPVTRTVTVVDEAPPTLALTGPATVGVECGSAYNELGAVANDACFGDLTAAIVKSGMVDTLKPAQYTVVYNVTDPAGQIAPPVSRTVNVADSLPPSINVVGPTNTTFECGTTYQDPGATASDVCAGDLTAKVVATRTPVPGQPGTVSISYSVTDPSGNTTTSGVSRTVRMIDEEAPVLTLRGSPSENKECGTPYADPGATANDTCVGTLQVVVTGTVDHTTASTYVLTYTATDLAGNTDTETRTVRITDTQGPVITLNGAASLRLECNRDLYVEPGAEAIDACSGAEAVTVDASAVNAARPGSYEVRYSATDNSGNPGTRIRNVLVEDSLAPVLTLNGPSHVVLECATGTFNDPLASAMDGCEGDVSDSVFREFSNLELNKVGSYFARYQVQDSSGLVARTSRDLEVRDSTPPVLTLAGDREPTVECGTPYNDPGATAADACSGDLTASILTMGAVNSNLPGSYMLGYRVTDPARQTASDLRTVSVTDTLAPRVTMAGPAELEVECGDSTYADPGASAADACAGVLRAVPDTVAAVNRPGSYTIRYSATDPSGNTGTSADSRTVTVIDTQKPRIVCLPQLVAQAGNDGFATVTLAPALAEDSCSAVEVSPGPLEQRFPVGSTPVTYVARDASGNEARCTSTVVVEAPPPQPEQPADWDQAFLGGGRGCSATGGESSLSMVGLLALLARFARKRQQQVPRRKLIRAQLMAARVLVLAVLLVGAAAFAQPVALPEFELERLKLNPSGLGSLLAGTGELLPDHGHRFALTTHYENDPLVLYQNGIRQGVVVRHRATAHLSVAYGLWKRVELGAQVPLVLLQRGDDLASRNVGSPRGGMALSTPLLSARLRLLAEREEDAVDLSVGILAGPRIGQSGALARELRAFPSVMLGRRFGFLRGGLDAGLFLRRRTILSPDRKIQDELGHALHLGATLATTGQKLRGELAVIAAVPLQREGYSVETLAGARLPLSASTEAYGLAGLGYGTAAGTPDFRVLFGVAYGKTPPAPVVAGQPEPLERPGPDIAENEVERPSTDMDSDGLEDGTDACPAEPGIVEMKGCPPKDSDGDTVCDHQDNCPNEPGPADNQGCPVAEKQLVAIQKDRIEIRDTVHFDFDQATIQPRSFPLLDQVARVLLKHPEIVAVTIEGHTDDKGPDEYNRELSQRRAEAVRDYFVQKGVATERLEPRGFGEDRPLGSNDTEEGRAANRRVEFITRYAQSAQ